MKFTYIILSFFVSAIVAAQSYSFENQSISPFVMSNSSVAQLNIVQAPYKDGANSLEWSWTSPTELVVDYALTLKNFRDGVIFWVYNPSPIADPMRVEFRDANSKVQYYFDFGLNFSGWRICRIGSKYMLGEKSVSSNLKMTLKTPAGVNDGKLFIDRFSYVSDVAYQNAPDAQIPYNNEDQYITHWNSLWKWESELEYPIVASVQLEDDQVKMLESVENSILNFLPSSANNTTISNAKNSFTVKGFRRLDNYIVGAPLVVSPDLTSLDISFEHLGPMMMGFAMDALFNQDMDSRDKFIFLWDYALTQGFAWGSAMGNNHHYGYQTRDIFKAAFLMRNQLAEAGKLTEVQKALSFWSGLPESRALMLASREGVVDCWNTLLHERLIAAMMCPSMTERYRAVEFLIKWTESSVLPFNGNIGGIKPDGTVFHHGGHYPAYATGGLNGLSKFLGSIYNSNFNFSIESRKSISKALFAMSSYTNLRDWTIGISGRHPHDGEMTDNVVEAFAYLALMGGLKNESDSIDADLASEYLRLGSTNSFLLSKFSNYSANANPQGFYVLNHAALGSYKYNTAMVTVKGYNSDVWGSEIYTKDNRYGRYQSYGAVEILNGGSPVTRAGSRFAENGWDWNRLPGTTTIHLPLNLLESPQTTTLMARSEEDFAGASSLLNTFGVFGMKLKEKNDINNLNFTPDFVARKSVFAFDKRIVCIGTGITNSNVTYDTETTLYQNQILTSDEKIGVNGNFVEALGYSFNSGLTSDQNLVSDLNGNYYLVKGNNQVIVEGKLQTSAENKLKAPTSGNFVTARIAHGKNPLNASYEYMIMLKPTPLEQRRWTTDPAYRVIKADQTAHIVVDDVNALTAMVCFEITDNPTDQVKKTDKELLIMYKQQTDGKLNMSVCDPSLHFPVKVKNSENTVLDGLTMTKTIELNGKWKFENSVDNATLTYSGETTIITFKLKLGRVIEFELLPYTTDIQSLNFEYPMNIINDRLLLNFSTKSFRLYDISSKLIAKSEIFSPFRELKLSTAKVHILSAVLENGETLKRKVIR